MACECVVNNYRQVRAEIENFAKKCSKDGTTWGEIWRNTQSIDRQQCKRQFRNLINDGVLIEIDYRYYHCSAINVNEIVKNFEAQIETLKSEAHESALENKNLKIQLQRIKDQINHIS